MGRGKLFSPWPSVVRNCYGLEVKVDNAAAECNREPAVCTESLNCSEEQEWIWRSQKAVPMDQEALSRVYCHPKALYQAWKQASACKGVGHCKGKTPGMSTSKLWDSKSCHSVIKEKKKKETLQYEKKFQNVLFFHRYSSFPSSVLLFLYFNMYLILWLIRRVVFWFRKQFLGWSLLENNLK